MSLLEILQRITKRRSRRKSKLITYETEAEIKSALSELLVYFVFLALTTSVTINSRDILLYYFNQTIDRLFLQREIPTEYDISLVYEDIVTVSDWWAFMESTLLDGLHGKVISWVNATETPAAEEMIEEKRVLKENLLLGPPRLRQVRVKAGSCEVSKEFKRQFRTCYAEYSKAVEEVGGQFLGSKYHHASNLHSYDTWGRLALYSGGGYIENFNFDREYNENLLQRLKHKKWVDRGTRLVTVEFALYNANTNFFCSASFLAEMLPTGSVLTSSQVHSLKLLRLWAFGDYLEVVILVAFYCMIAYYTYEEVMDVLDFGIHIYMKSMWNYLDAAVLIIGYLSLAYNIFHPIYLRRVLKKFESNPDEHLNLDVIFYWNLIYNDMMAVGVFLVWIKIFKYISFNKTMMQFSTTLRRCAKDIFGFGVMFGIVFLAYAQLGYLLFGTQHRDFRNFSESIITMLRMVLGDFEYAAIEEANRVLGPIFFLSYILLVFFILLNMFLAIINDTYTDVKSEIQESNANLGSYLSKILKNFFSLEFCKRRMLGKSITASTVEESLKEEQQVPEDGEDVDAISVTIPETTISSANVRKRRDIRLSQIITLFEELPSSSSLNAASVEEINEIRERITLIENSLEKLHEELESVLKRIPNINNA